MGNYPSQGDKEEKARSDVIDSFLEKERRRLKNECTLLLMGSTGSGKSTLMKQMMISWKSGFSTTEIEHFRLIVYKNVVDSAKEVVRAVGRIGLREALELRRKPSVTLIENYELKHTNNILTQEMAIAIKDVWQDAAVKRLLDEYGSEFYLMDNVGYFFDRVMAIGTLQYMPDTMDILMAQAKRSTVEMKFKLDSLSMHIVDVGGQCSERRKWIHCFESVTSIIFCVALSDYDLEERNQNRMSESLALFESTINTRWFLRTSIILLLNKLDVFKEKLGRVPLEHYFPEYTGGSDINKAAKYILWKFMQTNRARLSVYPHLTNLTEDTTTTKLVFAAVKETIVQNGLKGCKRL